ncbi:MAG TPA: hypothetical protein VIM84_08825 [Gemmatimonadales bacterium]
MTIQGRGFGSQKGTVRLTSTLLPVLAWSDTAVVVQWPADRGWKEPLVTVTRADGKWVSTMAFVARPLPGTIIEPPPVTEWEAQAAINDAVQGQITELRDENKELRARIVALEAR